MRRALEPRKDMRAAMGLEIANNGGGGVQWTKTVLEVSR